MKYAKFNFIFWFLFSQLGHATTATLPEATEAIRTKQSMEFLRQGVLGHIVPRNSAGVAASGAGSLGTALHVWDGVNINPVGANNGLRSYAKYFEIDLDENTSFTRTSTAYGNRLTIPASGSISNPSGKPLLINFGCYSGGSSSIKMNNVRTLIWVRLGRLVGVSETYLQTFTYRLADVLVLGIVYPPSFFPTSAMSFLDVSPPAQDFKYIVDFAVADMDASSPSADFNMCVQVVSL